MNFLVILASVAVICSYAVLQVYAGCGCNPNAPMAPTKNNLGLYEGDMMFTEVQEKFIKENKTASGFRNLVNPSQRWPGGVIPYTYFSDYSRNTLQKHVEPALAKFSQRLGGCITFRPKQPSDQYWLIVFTGEGCYSYVGRAQRNGQQLSLAYPGCQSEGTIMHEFMHAIGFFHEQSRPDRDQHIRVHWENIKNDGNTCSNFNKEGTLPPYPYDVKSVMQYESTAFSCNEQPTMTTANGGNIERSELSALDIQKIKNFYQCK